MELPQEETWSVVDSTKLQAYMTCPRKYFFEYVLGWRSERPSVHLEFGSAWHLAMEHMLAEKPSRGYSAESVLVGYEKLEAYYRRFFSPFDDEANAPKNPGNAFRALHQYASYYCRDEFKVHHTEVVGSILLDEKHKLFFKIDAICEDERGVFVIEHKTGSRHDATWDASWLQKMQMGVYTHVLYSHYPISDVWGILVNGAFIKNVPKRAGTEDNKFQRVPIRRNLQSMLDWFTQASRWVRRLDEDMAILENESAGSPVMAAFPKNTESCTHWGICPYLDYCNAWRNPLQKASKPPEGFVVKRWDPRRIETAKVVLPELEVQTPENDMPETEATE